MLDKKTVLRLIGPLLIFIVFIASPFILFVRAMLFLSDDSAFGMFIRLFNMAALPIEILSVGIINLIGFLILKKESKWKKISLIYLLLQTIISMIDCQVKCNKINEKIYKALRGEYESQGVYGDDY